MGPRIINTGTNLSRVPVPKHLTSRQNGTRTRFGIYNIIKGETGQAQSQAISMPTLYWGPAGLTGCMNFFVCVLTRARDDRTTGAILRQTRPATHQFMDDPQIDEQGAPQRPKPLAIAGSTPPRMNGESRQGIPIETATHGTRLPSDIS